MQRVILISGVILFLIRATASQSQTNPDFKGYNLLTERYFDAQNFDSCLYYNYILANHYVDKQDTAGLINTWYNIGIVNLLQKKQAYARAARLIARQYIRGNVTCKPPTLQHKFCYIQQLSEAEYNSLNNQFAKAKEILHKLLNNLKEKGDTNWFGYAKANMLMGDYFYDKLAYFQSIGYYETAIRIYEANQIFNSNWVRTYRYFLYALLFSGQSEKRDSCFKRIEMSNLIKKNGVAKLV